jgi:hypothetical protein
MKVLDLCCARGHRFEGWFASDEDFQSQTERGLLECPLCASQDITRLPSAPRLNLSGARETPSTAAKPPAGGAPAEITMQATWLRAVQHFMDHTENVGERFAEEARRIHYGEANERPIRGVATLDEAEALKDEGIEVMSLPVPAALKGPIQ